MAESADRDREPAIPGAHGVQRRNAIGPIVCDHPDRASGRDRALAGAGRRLSGAEIHPALAAGDARDARLGQICLGLQPRGDGSRNPRRLLPRRAGRRGAGGDVHLVAADHAAAAAAVRDAEHDPEGGARPAVHRLVQLRHLPEHPDRLSASASSRSCSPPRGASARSSPICSISSNRCAARAGRCSARSSCRARCLTCSPA